MKRKLLLLVIGLVLMFALVGCEEKSTINVNVENDENISTDHLGDFISIGNNLVYDPATRIVYIENITYGGDKVYTPYYAPNGLPYRYNPETNTFEESDLSEYLKNK